MRHGKHWIKFVLLALAGIAAAALVVMLLWNHLAPELFGWPSIGFLQALGLLILTRLLFGGFRGRPGLHGHWRRRFEARWMERWTEMAPEEREKFKAGMRCGWGRDKSEEAPAKDE